MRDGLKPSQRRILVAMNDLGLAPNKQHRKCAKIAGDTSGNYHPHGEAVIYPTLVRMAQDFNMRYTLVDGQGNFGSVEGDSPAAMRYTEARFSQIAVEMLRDIDANTVDWMPNYDETRREPTVLPSRMPNLMVNGASGIAVGMATNIPPHNLGEVVDAIVHLIDNPEADADDLMGFIKGPDFPTGGVILGTGGFKEAYRTGRGRVRVRAKAHTEQLKGNRTAIVVTELPVPGQPRRAHRQHRRPRQEQEAHRDQRPAQRVRPHRHAPGHRAQARGHPDGGAQQALQAHADADHLRGHQHRPRRRRAAHARPCRRCCRHTSPSRKRSSSGAPSSSSTRPRRGPTSSKACSSPSTTSTRSSASSATRPTSTRPARRSWTPSSSRGRRRRPSSTCGSRSSPASSATRSRRSTAGLLARIKELRELLGDENAIFGVIKNELLEIKRLYNDDRRTEIVPDEGEIDLEDLIAEEQMAITITKTGYVKRLPVATYRQQKRGGIGVAGMELKEEDEVEHLFITSTHNYLLFFTSVGKVYRLKVHELPLAGRNARGKHLVNLLPLRQDEKVRAVINTRNFDVSEGKYLIFGTRKGIVKKTLFGSYNTPLKADGIIAINMRDGDELIAVRHTSGDDDIIMVSRLGQAIRFHENDVRPTGRNTEGVTGMRLRAGDEVIAMDIARDDSDLFVITENGFGKRTLISEYPVQGRGGLGVRTIKLTDRKGYLAGVRVVRDNHEIMLQSRDGVVIRMRADGISATGAPRRASRS